MTPPGDNIYYGWQVPNTSCTSSDKSSSSSQSSSPGETSCLGRNQGDQVQREREQVQEITAKHSAAKPSSILISTTDDNISSRRGGLITRLR